MIEMSVALLGSVEAALTEGAAVVERAHSSLLFHRSGQATFACLHNHVHSSMADSNGGWHVRDDIFV